MNEGEPKKEYQKMTKDEANELLMKFFEQNNLKKNDIQIFDIQSFKSQKGGRWEFYVLKPYGLFVVYADGRVEDNYDTFKKN